MKVRYHIFAKIILFLLVSVGSALAFNITHIGSIVDSLFAPTSMTVTDDKIIVLEPFSKEIKVFSSEGVVSRRVNFSGDAHGLTVFNGNFIFCDLEQKKIIVVDITTSEQADLFEGNFNFSNPVDINICEGYLSVLDAGSSAIYQFDDNNSLVNTINIKNSRGDKIFTASSFDYNAENSTYYIFDQVNSSVVTTDKKGNFKAAFGSFGSEMGAITRGGDIIVTPDNQLVVTDRYQNRILVYDADGKFAGYYNLLNSSRKSINIPSGMVFDKNGMLYVASTEGANIQIFHISTSEAQGESIMAELMYPYLNDTVSNENLKLIVKAELSGENKNIKGFDFELYEVEDSGSLLANINNVVPIVSTDSLTSTISYTGEWVLDDELESDKLYNWRSRLSFSDSTGQWSEFSSFRTNELPNNYALNQNYPNPFNPSTNISFTIPIQSHVKLDIFNIMGQKIKTLIDDEYSAGSHEIRWDGDNDGGQLVATGVYFYRLSADNFVKSKKMVMIK